MHRFCISIRIKALYYKAKWHIYFTLDLKQNMLFQ